MTDPRDDAPYDGVDDPEPRPRRSAESAPSAPTAASAPSAMSALSAADLDEVSGTPAGTPEPTGSWRKVIKAPPAVTDPTPVMDAGLPDPPPPIPTWAKAVAIVGVSVLLVLSAWLGLSLGAPTPSASPSPTPVQPDWALEAPQVVGDFVRGESGESMDPANDERRIITSEYSDGTNRIVVLLSRPETDAPSYLLNAGVTDVTTEGEAACGTSADTGSPVCVRIVDRSAVMVLGLTGQSHVVLAENVEAFLEVLTG